MFVKRSLRDRLDCLVVFVGMNLLALRFLWLPSPNCFLRVCFPTIFAADLKDFLPLITSPISGAANSNMSAPMHFAAGTTYLRKNGIAEPQIPFPSAFQPLYIMEFLLVSKQPSCSIVCVRKECLTPF